MSISDVLWALPGLVAMWWVGRQVLAELPCGDLGTGGPRTPISDAALAWSLGWIVLAGEVWLLERWTGRPSAWAILWPWFTWSLLKTQRGPAALAPRSPQARLFVDPKERSGYRALLALGTLAWAWSSFGLMRTTGLSQARLPQVEGLLPLHLCGEWPLWLFGGERPGYALSPMLFGACLCIVHGSLARFAPRPLLLAALTLFLALAPAAPRWAGLAQLPRSGLGASVALCVTSAGALEWWRVADRRGRAIAWMGIAAIAWVEPRLWGASVAASLALVAFSPTRLRARTALGCVPALLIATAASAGVAIPSATPSVDEVRWAFLGAAPVLQALLPTGPWGLWNVLGFLALAWLLRAWIRGSLAFDELRAQLAIFTWVLMGMVVAPWFTGARVGSAWALETGPAAAHWVTLWTPVVALWVGVVVLSNPASGDQRSSS